MPNSKQTDKEQQFSNSKSNSGNGDNVQTRSEQIESLEKNITFANGYMAHNSDHMPKEDLENLKDKQKNRKDTLDTLK